MSGVAGALADSRLIPLTQRQTTTPVDHGRHRVVAAGDVAVVLEADLDPIGEACLGDAAAGHLRLCLGEGDARDRLPESDRPPLVTVGARRHAVARPYAPSRSEPA